jgi:DNA-binding XRE family transcriptional regulator
MAISIKAGRVNVGLTQEKAAKELGITRATLSSYESGKTIPDIETGKKMAALYKTTVDELNFSAK